MLHARPFIGGVPLYRQVQSGIEDMIRANPRARAIPLSDAQLAERFGVSRITVRRAVDELVDAGILYRIQGRGTFVRQSKLREKLTLNSFLDAWTPKAGGFNVRVAALERVPADDNVAESLAIQPGAEVVYVRRLRLQNETIVAIDDRYMRSQDCSRRQSASDSPSAVQSRRPSRASACASVSSPNGIRPSPGPQKLPPRDGKSLQRNVEPSVGRYGTTTTPSSRSTTPAASSVSVSSPFQ